MGVLRSAVEAAFRDYVTDGVPASGAHEPVKSEIRAALGEQLEAAIGAAAGNLIPFATVALMDANVIQADGALAYVYDNNGSASDPANGVYQWDDGATDWVAATWYFDVIVALAASAAADLVTPEALALIAAQPGFDAGYPNVYTTALPRGVMSGTVGGDAVTGATVGTYALTPTGGDIAGVEANLVVASATSASIVIVNPGLGSGTTPPTWAKPAGATLPAGTTITAVVAPRIAQEGIYFALSSDGLRLQGYRNDGTSTPAIIAGVSILTGSTLVDEVSLAMPDGRIAVRDPAGGLYGYLDPGLPDRVDRTLTPTGDLMAQIINADRMPRTRMAIRRLLLGGAAQGVLIFCGDSWVENTDRFVLLVAKILQDALGFAGQGWTGFGWYQFTAAPETIVFTTASNNAGFAGCARRDLAQLSGVIQAQSIDTVQLVGTWTCRYFEVAQASPTLSTVQSSTANDYVRWCFPAGHDAAILHYDGDGTGVIQVSWNDGSSYSSSVNLNTVGADQVALASVPATAETARIKVVSGNVRLAGVDMQSATSGVRVHKLGASGSRTTDWAAVPAGWSTAITSLSDSMVPLVFMTAATNNQNDATVPSAMSANLTAFAAAVRAGVAGAEIVIMPPAENQRPANLYPMTEYEAEQRAWSSANGCVHVNLQDSFGDALSPADYDDLFIDLIHPEPAVSINFGTGVITVGPTMIVDPIIRLLLPAN